MADTKSYGWAGKILRVNLTTGSITTEPTAPYEDYIGGMGLANKIIYDEVAPGTDPLSEDAKIVYAVGPLTATGVLPCHLHHRLPCCRRPLRRHVRRKG